VEQQTENKGHADPPFLPSWEAATDTEARRLRLMPEIETPRLRLRGFQADDLDTFAEISSDPEVTQYLGGPIGRADAWRALSAHVGHWTLLGFGRWAIVERETSRLVGWTGVLRVQGFDEPEVGWVLGRRSWGHGYATEAASASLRWAVQSAGLGPIISLIHAANLSSIAVADRLGARCCRCIKDGQGIPHLVYSHDLRRWR
jgi:RimJ/RimL family protein N-acetyltransferase